MSFLDVFSQIMLCILAILAGCALLWGVAVLDAKFYGRNIFGIFCWSVCILILVAVFSWITVDVKATMDYHANWCIYDVVTIEIEGETYVSDQEIYICNVEAPKSVRE